MHSPGAVDAWIHWDKLCEWTQNVCAGFKQREWWRGNPCEEALLWREPVALTEDREDPKLRDPSATSTSSSPDTARAANRGGARRNVVCIDTGVAYDEWEHLTIAEVQDGLVLHRLARVER